jgi:DNA-directed RNA polymerase III subunit RPC6
MPPRRHVVPPPTNPSSASPPPPDVDPSLTTDPEASSSGRGSNPAPPTITAKILSHLQPRQREVYRAIFAAGSGGMSAQDIRNATGLSADAGGKQARSLVGLGVLKVVPDVRNRRRSLFMAVEFKPSDEVTDGTWYHEGKVDAGAIAAARRRCLAQVKRLGAATADMIHEGVRRCEPGAGYTADKIADILRTMVLDNTLEEVRSTGEGEFAAVRRGTMCYREPGKQHPGGMMEEIPCGVCPMIDDCSPEGIISPSTCVYYQKWLKLDF